MLINRRIRSYDTRFNREDVGITQSVFSNHSRPSAEEQEVHRFKAEETKLE
jgi:hypothetical protein